MSIPYAMETNNMSSSQGLEPLVILCQDNQPADLQLWDSSFFNFIIWLG